LKFLAWAFHLPFLLSSPQTSEYENLPLIDREIDLPADRLLKWSLDIQDTDYLDEHLELKEKQVKILNYNNKSKMQFMEAYQYNLIARKYHVQTVAMEILKSYQFLMKNTESFKVLHDEKGIWMARNDSRKISFDLTRDYVRDVRYKVLADKFLVFEKDVYSFWSRLHRDIEQKWLYNPLEYYLFWFSLLFGFATLVQTVAAMVPFFKS
jgi:hypothetical protein